MSKKAKTNPSGVKPDLQIVIDKPIYDLLKGEKITHLFTWKDTLTHAPNIIGVTSTEDDEQILVKCKQMDTVGFGYIAPGYPSKYATNRRTTRFLVEPITEPVKEESTGETENAE
jgi:hypothetical protein